MFIVLFRFWIRFVIIYGHELNENNFTQCGLFKSESIFKFVIINFVIQRNCITIEIHNMNEFKAPKRIPKCTNKDVRRSLLVNRYYWQTLFVNHIRVYGQCVVCEDNNSWNDYNLVQDYSQDFRSHNIYTDSNWFDWPQHTIKVRFNKSRIALL